MPKAGNRYQSALAIAKRARNIENRRVIEGDTCIKDAVDVAAQEIVDEKVVVKYKGEYVYTPEVEELEEELEEQFYDKKAYNNYNW